jgi:hypothetical protein
METKSCTPVAMVSFNELCPLSAPAAILWLNYPPLVLFHLVTSLCLSLIHTSSLTNLSTCLCPLLSLHGATEGGGSCLLLLHKNRGMIAAPSVLINTYSTLANWLADRGSFLKGNLISS